MNVLWGPYNHQELDLFIEKQLSTFDLRSFGSNGSDFNWATLSDPPIHPDQWQPDLILLIEPALRLFPLNIFNLNVPVIAISSWRHLSTDILKMLSGLIYLWGDAPENEKVLNYIPMNYAGSIVPKPSSKNKSIVGAGVRALDSSWHTAFENSDVAFYSVQDQTPPKQMRLLTHAPYVFIEDTHISALHFQVLMNGAFLLYPAENKLLAPYLNKQKRAIPCVTHNLKHSLNTLPDPLETTKLNIQFPTLIDLIHNFDLQPPQIAFGQIESIIKQIWMEGPALDEFIFVFQNDPSLHSGFLSLHASLHHLSITASEWADLYDERSQELLNQFSEEEVTIWQHLVCQLKHPIYKIDLDKTETQKLIKDLILIDPQWVMAFLSEKPEFLNETFLKQLIALRPESADLHLLLLRSSQQEQQNQNFVQRCIELLYQNIVHFGEEKFWQDLNFCLDKLPTFQGSILWHGHQHLQKGSRGRINQAYTQTLNTLDISVCVVPESPVLMFDDQPLPPHFRPEILITNAQTHLTSCALHIPWVEYMPWAYSHAPRNYVSRAQELIDEIWVPSEYSKQSLLRSGVPTEKIQVIPYGVDTNCFKPEGNKVLLPTQKNFAFLYLGGVIARKGIDLLLNAFCKAFSHTDDVCLVIKEYGSASFYTELASDFRTQIKQAQANPENPEIILIRGDTHSDSELADLYRACDVYIQPYRAESFGLSILEAMASGLPVIIPEFGPAQEFVPASSGWHLPGSSQFIEQRNYRDSDHCPYFTELPSSQNEIHQESLIKVMQEVVQNPKQRQEKAIQARRQALNYDWKKQAHTITDRIHSLSKQTEPHRFKQLRLAHYTQDVQKDLLKLNNSEAQKKLAKMSIDDVHCQPELLWLHAQTLWNTQHIEVAVNKAREAICLGLDYTKVLAHPLWSALWKKPLIFLAPHCLAPLSEALFERCTTPEESDICWGFNHPDGKPSFEWEPGMLDTSLFQPLPFLNQKKATVIGFIDLNWKDTAKSVVLVLQALSLWQKPVKLLLFSVQDAVRVEGMLQSLLKQIQWKPVHQLEIVLQNTPQTPDKLRKAFQNARVLLDLNPKANRFLLGVAQLMGIRLITREGKSFLQSPFSECIKQGDEKRILWLLPKLLNDHNTRLDALAVRDHILKTTPVFNHSQVLVAQWLKHATP